MLHCLLCLSLFLENSATDDQMVVFCLEQAERYPEHAVWLGRIACHPRPRQVAARVLVQID